MANRFTDAVHKMIVPGDSKDRIFMKAILMAMAWHTNNETGTFFVTYKTLAREACAGERTVKRHVPELIELGLVSVIGKKRTKAGYCPIYQMNLEAIMCLDSRCQDGTSLNEDGASQSIVECQDGTRGGASWVGRGCLPGTQNSSYNSSENSSRNSSLLVEATATAGGVEELSTEQEKIKASMIQRMPKLATINFPEGDNWNKLTTIVLAGKLESWNNILPELAKYRKDQCAVADSQSTLSEELTI